METYKGSKEDLNEYIEIAHEMHLAISSGDDTMREGVGEMFKKREDLAQKLKLNPEEIEAALIRARTGF